MRKTLTSLVNSRTVATALFGTLVLSQPNPTNLFFGKSKQSQSDKVVSSPPTKSFIWGNSSFLVKADPSIKYKNLEPKHIKTFNGSDSLSQLVFGEHYEAGIDTQGSALIWPKQFLHDSTPRDSDNSRQNIIKLDTKNKNYVSIAFTKGFVWALNKNGQVYSWAIQKEIDGNNKVISTNVDPASQRHIKSLPENIKQIACGFDHILVLTQSGEVFTMGDDTYGQCGSGALGRKVSPPFYERRVKNPRKVEGISNGSNTNLKVSRIACGLNHSLAITEDGKLFGWGYNSNMQLSQEDGFSKKEQPVIGIYSPQLMSKGIESNTVIDVAAGEEHTIVVTENSKTGETEVFSCGHNRKGELGTGNLRELSDFKKIESLSNFSVKNPSSGETEHVRVSQISCGNHHCIALLSAGIVTEWGENDYGQMGNRKRSHLANPTVISTFKKSTVLQVAAGSNSTGIICLDQPAQTA